MGCCCCCLLLQAACSAHREHSNRTMPPPQPGVQRLCTCNLHSTVLVFVGCVPP